MTLVIQVNNAKVDKAPMTLAAKKMAEKSAKAEAEYADGKISPAYLLRLVARQYDDEATLASLANANAHAPADGPDNGGEPGGAGEAQADDLQDDDAASQSILPTPLDEEPADDDDDDIIDDVEITPEEEDTWILSDDWEEPQPALPVAPQVAAAAAAAPRALTLADFSVEARIDSLTVQQRFDSLRTKDVNEFVSVTCGYCLGKLTTLYITNCEHSLCSGCLLRLPKIEVRGHRKHKRACPICREVIFRTTRVKTSAVFVAWKPDIESGFNTAHLPQNTDEDGQRPADEAWELQQQREDEEYARELQGEPCTFVSLLIVISLSFDSYFQVHFQAS